MRFKSRAKVFDWTVPDEWNIRDAFIKDEKGKKREQEHNVSLIQTPWIFNHWSIHCTKTNNNFKTIL